MSLDSLFSRYGSPSTEANFTIHGYFVRADHLDEQKRIKSMDDSAARMIKELEDMTHDLREYRATLAARYGELETMPYKLRLELQREKRYQGNVVYHLRMVKVYQDGTEAKQEATTYPGTERHKAIAAFEAAKKAHPGIDCLKAIEKGKWER